MNHLKQEGSLPENVTDAELLALRPVKPRKKATFECPTPSKYCHICSRTTNRGIRLAPCLGLREGKCRKVVCEVCFADHALGRTFLEAIDPHSRWQCTHCTQSCPERAQCRTYQTVNRKLRLQRLRQSVTSKTPKEHKRASERPPTMFENAKPVQEMYPSLGEYGKSADSLQSNTRETICVHEKTDWNDSNSSSKANLVPEKLGPVHVVRGDKKSQATGNAVGKGSDKNDDEGKAQSESSQRVDQYFFDGQAQELRLVCHLCGKSCGDADGFKACENPSNPRCRKLYCNVCCISAPPVRKSLSIARIIGNRWSCTHCTQECPMGSFCPLFAKEVTSSNSRQSSIGLSKSICRKKSTARCLKARILAGVSERGTSSL